jgi:ketosteroid isomerase-like protein
VELNLPAVIDDYLRTKEAHDVKGMIACFAEDAVVRDESHTHEGKAAIEAWMAETIAKYQFRCKPLRYEGDEAGGLASVEVSGNFPGSPVTLDYRFKCADGKIAELTIE